MGTRGHPALFSRELFPELLSAPASEGARHVLHAHLDQVSQVDVPEKAVLVRIDTPEDYRLHFGTDPLAAGIVGRGES
jgi:molybdenum cofactor cytidylyltransferase